jgi:acyl-coenzyme A thioesterase PaaI-like protein
LKPRLSPANLAGIMSATASLQERFAPASICFGCGPANRDGLRIRSLESPDGTALICDWQPAPIHRAYEGILNGGIIGTLLDCHSNWTAAWHIMRTRGLATPQVCVTAEFAVRLRRPTPVDGPVHLRAWVESALEDRAVILAELNAAGKVTATCRGTFVAVRPDHPAFHQWS